MRERGTQWTKWSVCVLRICVPEIPVGGICVPGIPVAGIRVPGIPVAGIHVPGIRESPAESRTAQGWSPHLAAANSSPRAPRQWLLLTTEDRVSTNCVRDREVLGNAARSQATSVKSNQLFAQRLEMHGY